MTEIRRHLRPALCVAALLCTSAPSVLTARQAPAAAAQASPPTLTPLAAVAPLPSDADIERFLSEGRIIQTRGTKTGVTDSVRATLSDGVLTHDAHIQVVDEYKREFRTTMGLEFDFRDSWTFNVAAYRIDRLIGLHMVPVSIPGRFQAKPAAITWWVDDVLMDEGARLKKKIPPPDPLSWARQMRMLRLFAQLIYNIDRNVGNLLIAREWRIWAIDHTRAFRKFTTLVKPASITGCDRAVFARLKDLDRDRLQREVGQFLDPDQIKAILARRDAIVARLDSLGPGVLFTSGNPRVAR